MAARLCPYICSGTTPVMVAVTQPPSRRRSLSTVRSNNFRSPPRVFARGRRCERRFSSPRRLATPHGTSLPSAPAKRWQTNAQGGCAGQLLKLTEATSAAAPAIISLLRQLPRSSNSAFSTTWHWLTRPEAFHPRSRSPLRGWRAMGACLVEVPCLRHFPLSSGGCRLASANSY